MKKNMYLATWHTWKSCFYDWVRFWGTVEPRFNEVLRDWGNWFVKSRVRYAENLDLTNLRKNNQNVRYIEIWLIIKKIIKSFLIASYFVFR